MSRAATNRSRGTCAYTDVRDYHEGKAEWIGAGLPTERAVTATTTA